MLIVVSLAYAAFCLAFGKRTAPIVGGFIVSLAIGCSAVLRLDPLGMFVIGYILLSVWAVDIFAMFSGKLIGGLKLAPIISPKNMGRTIWYVGAALAAGLFSDGCRFRIW